MIRLATPPHPAPRPALARLARTVARCQRDLERLSTRRRVPTAGELAAVHRRLLGAVVALGEATVDALDR
jgi:hypothetical protein